MNNNKECSIISSAEYEQAVQDIENSRLEYGDTPFESLRDLRLVAEAYAIKGIGNHCSRYMMLRQERMGKMYFLLPRGVTGRFFKNTGGCRYYSRFVVGYFIRLDHFFAFSSYPVFFCQSFG